MEVTVQSGSLAEFSADVLVVNLFEGVTSPGGGTGSVDSALGGVLSDELQHGNRFKGKLGETLVFPTYGKIPARYVVLVGLGKAEKFKATQCRRTSAAAIRACKALKVKSVATLLHGAGIGQVDPQAAARLLAEGTLLGAYKFTKRKGAKAREKDSESETTLESVTIVERDAAKLDAIQRGLTQGLAIAGATNAARDLVFDSANYVTPTVLAETAQAIAGPNITCKVYDKSDIEMMGMGSFLSVTQGSAQPPKLIHLTYLPASGTPRKKVALVGKGITFDSGGLSLKPPAGMELMKDDMSGAAAVISTMKAIAALQDLDIQVDVIVPSCENMPSGTATRPGDIVTAMNGKTIEINNTDAEGRLILADALTYAQQQVKPDELIDMATLTGACLVALGKEASGMMGTDEGLMDRLKAAGEIAGERFWPLPLYDEYKEMLKSEVADLINAGSKGQAGSSAGGIFLKEFVDEGQNWVHLDIAGPAYTDRDVPETPKGATGCPVRTLLYYLYDFAQI